MVTGKKVENRKLPQVMEFFHSNGKKLTQAFSQKRLPCFKVVG